MNRKWCTAEFWTESLKWLVFRLSSACIRSARLAQLCRVLGYDLLIPLSFSQPFPGQSPSLSAWLFLSPVLASVYPQRLCLFYLEIICIFPTLGKGESWNHFLPGGEQNFQKVAKVSPLFLPFLLSPTHLMGTQQRKWWSLITIPFNLAALTHTDL